MFDRYSNFCDCESCKQYRPSEDKKNDSPGVPPRNVVQEILVWLRSGDPSRDDFPGGPVGATAHDIADYIEKRWGSP